MIRLEQISKCFNRLRVLDRVDMEVDRGCRAVVLGPSGAGKTVLLKIMAGLIKPDSGRVVYREGVISYGRFADNSAILNKVGFVFQGGALFDWLTVADNIALPLRERGIRDEKSIRERVRELLVKVGLEKAENMRIGELSGGMRVLLAIARALVNDPAYLFFDEPTSGLDPASRDRICQLISEICAAGEKVAVIVTHDLESARKLATRIYLLKNAQLIRAEEVKKEDYEQTVS